MASRSGLPLPSQRFVRHSHDRRSVAVHTAGKQACLHEGIGYCLFIWAERRAWDPAAGRLSVALYHGELGQCRHRRLTAAPPAQLVGQPARATL